MQSVHIHYTFMMILLFFLSCRVKSRVCIAPFKSPAVAPSNEEEQGAFDELDDTLNKGILSAVCGLVVKVGKSLHDRSMVREMAARFSPHFPGRQAINWALLGVCVKEVIRCYLFRNTTTI